MIVKNQLEIHTVLASLPIGEVNVENRNIIEIRADHSTFTVEIIVIQTQLDLFLG